MKIYKLKYTFSNDKSSGNCGMYAIALGKKALDDGKNVFIAIVTDTEDLDELMFGEPNVYHVAIEIDGVLYDGNGQISENEMFQFAFDIYGDANAHLLYLDFNEDAITMIRTQTNWDTSWQIYYKELIGIDNNGDMGNDEEFIKSHENL